jgi:hypothetical protein
LSLRDEKHEDERWCQTFGISRETGYFWILERDQPGGRWPATSTIGAREGLVVPRRKRPRTAPYTEPLAHAAGPIIPDTPTHASTPALSRTLQTFRPTTT